MRIWYQSFVDEENGAEYWRHLRAHLAAVADEGTEITVHGITPYDSYAHAIVEMRCAREVVCNAVRAEREGYDAVVSLGEATMLQAATLGMRSALITINKRYIPWHLQQIKRLGLGERVTGVHAMQFEPGQILAAFDDPEKINKVCEIFDRQATPLVDAGAEVLIPAGVRRFNLT